MFTLIGIGAGLLFLFSVFGLFFPDVFPGLKPKWEQFICILKQQQ
jgi:hypothetical protein